MDQEPAARLPLAELLIIAVLFLAGICGLYLNFFEPFEVKTLDARYPLIQLDKPHKDIVLVTIDDDDINEIGEWPWPRGIHARLVRNLKAAGARVIGFDVFFDTASTDSAEDESFVAACREAGNVITAVYFNETTTPLTLPEAIRQSGTTEVPVFSLQSRGDSMTRSVSVSSQFRGLNEVLAGQGLVDLGYNRLNPDGIIRFVDLSVRIGERQVHSLGLEMARHFLGVADKAVEEEPGALRIPGVRIPLFEHNQWHNGAPKTERPFIVRYTGPENTMFRTIPYSSVLQGSFPAEFFRNAIVIVGASAESFFDIKRTPFGPAPGMNINALITRSILEKDFLTRPSRFWTALQMLALVLLAGLYLIRVRPRIWDILLLALFCYLWWQWALYNIVRWSWLVETVAPVVLVAGVVIFTRFWQMFVRLHLSNLALSRSNRLLDARVHELETLHDLSSSIQDVSDLKRITRTFVAKSMGVVKAHQGVYLSFDEHAEHLRLEESLFPGTPAELLPERLVQLGQMLLGEKEVQVLDEKDERFRQLDLRSFGIGSLLFSPLYTKREELIGQLILCRPAGEPGFIKEDRRVIYLASLQAASVIENTKLYLMAVIDGLTQLYVRRYFDARLNHEVRRHKRYGGELSLLLMDIDHFKTFNDTYGHQTGDQVLRDTARLVVANLRDVDLAARYGGEELCVLLPETPRSGALHVAERIRRSIEENRSPGPGGEQLQVTISIGICVFDDHNTLSPEDMVHCADVALYHSKENGRNQVTVYDPETMAGA